LDLAEKIKSDSAWFGFSAATGGLNQEHLICRWLLLKRKKSVEVEKKDVAVPVPVSEDEEEAKMLAEALALSLKS
jgi:hypothetical protein